MTAKLRQLLTVSVFCALLGLLGILHVVLPDEAVSVSERRKLASVP